MCNNDQNRRRFLGTAVLTLAAAPFGLLGGVVAASPLRRRGINGTLGPLKQIDAGSLNVGYVDSGPADGPVVLLLHGWPDVIDLMDALKIGKAVIGGFDWGGRSANIVAALWPGRCKAMVSVSGYLITGVAANKQPLPPAAEYRWRPALSK